MKIFTLCACLLLLACPLAARADAPDGLQPFCLVLATDEIDATWTAIDRLAAMGCADLMTHGAGVIEGRVAPAAASRLESAGRIRRVFLAPADEASLASLPDPVRLRISVWNAVLAKEAERSKTDPAAAEEITAGLSSDACVLLPPVARPAGPAKSAQSGRDIPRLPKYNKAWGAEDYQTSEFLLGRVAVGIVTPQVRGGARWTKQALEDVAAASRNAMYFWKARASKWSDYPIYLAFEYLDSLSTNTSPLTASNDMRWVSPLMDSARERLGITAPPPPGKSAQIPDQTFADVYQVVNFMRTKWHADWGILIVVGLGERFTEQPGLGAYAFLGGPFLVSPNKPTNWGLEGLLIHESGHLFFALDEYCCGGTSSPCSAVSGYLAIANRNSRNRGFGGCAPNSAQCAMATPMRQACSYTEEMMGIKDSNGDGIRDVLSTQPIVEIFQRDGLEMLDSLGRRALSDTITTLTPSFSGVVRDAPLVNKIAVSGVGAGDGEGAAAGLEIAAGVRAPITMNTLASAEYRIADIDTAWRWIRPDSSGYDSAVEDFRVFISGLSGGTHTIEFGGTNSTGKSTERNATTKHRLVVLAVALDSLAVANELGGGLDITWAVRGEAWGSSAKLYRSEDGGPEQVLTTVPLRSNARFAIADKAVRPGHRYSYRVETEAFGKTYSLSTEGTASAPIRDPEQRLSAATPNPFFDETFLSYVVPEGVLGPRPPKDGGNKPGPPPELPTSPHGEMGSSAEAAAAVEYVRLPVGVTVTIHDASGRVVRHLIGDYVAGARIYTTRWNGNDDDGQRLPAGVYFSRLQAGAFVDTNKLVLMK